MANIQLSNLLPDFSYLFTLTNEGISATVVAILFIISLGFSIKTFFDYRKSKSQINFYKEQFSKLKETSSESFAAKWREVGNDIKKHSKDYADLWNEFAESLVNVYTPTQRLCNVVDASHFFNTHTLATQLTENRLLASVPGVLTAIGVLGTFGGLQLGLGDFSGLDSNSPTNILRDAIFTMIGGAGIAFMTSVWGVLCSLIFNFYEKALERKIRHHISELQQEIDYLFPRVVAEQTLTNIENHTENSRVTLAGLSEKIGDRMQEVMEGVSQTISTEISKAIISVMENMAEKASNSSENALETLITEFTTKIGSAGDEQRQAMQQATAELARVPEMLKGMLEQTQQQLAGGISQQQAKDKERQKMLTDNLALFMTDLKNQFATMSEQTEKSVAQIQNQLQVVNKQNAERETHLQGLFSQNAQRQTDLVSDIKALSVTQQNENKVLINSLSELASKFETLSKIQEQTVQNMVIASQNMQSSSAQFNQLSENLKSAVSDFGTKLTSAITMAQAVATKHEQSAKLFDGVNQQFSAASQAVEKTAVVLKETAQQSEATMVETRNSFKGFNQELQDYIEQLNEQISQLLTDYSTQVNAQTGERLNEWNKQTAEYSSTMRNAISAISDIVDEISDKMPRR